MASLFRPRYSSESTNRLPRAAGQSHASCGKEDPAMKQNDFDVIIIGSGMGAQSRPVG